jgi:hypothetical protein
LGGIDIKDLNEEDQINKYLTTTEIKTDMMPQLTTPDNHLDER